MTPSMLLAGAAALRHPAGARVEPDDVDARGDLLVARDVRGLPVSATSRFGQLDGVRLENVGRPQQRGRAFGGRVVSRRDRNASRAAATASIDVRLRRLGGDGVRITGSGSISSVR